MELMGLRLLQLLALTALVMLVVLERQLMLEPLLSKVRTALRQLRRRKLEKQLRMAQLQVTKAANNLRTARETLVATELAEMPGMALLPQTVEHLTRLEPKPLPFLIQEKTPTQSSIDSPKP